MKVNGTQPRHRASPQRVGRVMEPVRHVQGSDTKLPLGNLILTKCIIFALSCY